MRSTAMHKNPGNRFGAVVSFSRGAPQKRLLVQRDNQLPIEGQAPSIEVASERSERLASLITLSSEPMLTWRLDGSIEFWNAGATQLYGYSAEEAIGRSSHALLKTVFPVDFRDLSAQL